MTKINSNYSIAKAIKHAMQGLRYILVHERNARLHLVTAIVVFIAGWQLRLNNRELAAIFFAVLLVFLAEIFNSAIEKMLDIIKPEHSLEVKLVKDMAAGAVLVATVGAFVLGVAIFYPVLSELAWLK